mgnify:CR=1 FL=1
MMQGPIASSPTRPTPAMGAAAPKTFRNAVIQIVVADVSMSLDNVLAVAGVARDHTWVLVVGLILSVAFMGAAAALIAGLLKRYHWISYVGLAIIFLCRLPDDLARHPRGRQGDSAGRPHLTTSSTGRRRSRRTSSR